MEQIVIYLLTVQRLLNLKKKIQKFQHSHYAQETFQKIGRKIYEKNWFNGHIYDFSADYNTIAVDEKVFNEKEWSSIKMFEFIKQIH